MSRIVDGRFIFLRTMGKLEAFHGVQVLTHCLMSNHFHVLLEVPDRERLPYLTASGLLDLLSGLYSKDTVNQVRQELKRADGDEGWTQQIVERYQKRRGKLDTFMKDLKQRFYPPCGRFCGAASLSC